LQAPKVVARLFIEV